MVRVINRTLNGLITLVVAFALIIAGLYAGYALWDNHQIYSAAESTQLEMLRFKPVIGTAEGGMAEAPSFEELYAINQDVCAWVTMDNTAIDFPVLQGSNNLEYINTDVYGNFALAGSIFLDTRCQKDMSGSYSLFYGHHMDNHGMFGDLDLYKEPDFFGENTTGTLITPQGVHALTVLACVVTEASDDALFDPDNWNGDVTLSFDAMGRETFVRDSSKLVGLVDYMRKESLHYHAAALDAIDAAIAMGEDPQILALSTCSSEYTNARTIVLTRIEPAPETSLMPEIVLS